MQSLTAAVNHFCLGTSRGEGDVGGSEGVHLLLGVLIESSAKHSKKRVNVPKKRRLTNK